MAKRGYRGKHPNNDMKVASGENAPANLDKLTKEYNKTGVKNKYDYIKSHDGFNPVGAGSVTFPTNTAATVTKTITIISTDGTSVAYAATASEDTEANQYLLTAGHASQRTSLIACVNAVEGHGGKILATAGAANGEVILTQVEPGPHGNTTITCQAESQGTAVNFTNG